LNDAGGELEFSGDIYHCQSRKNKFR